MVTTRGKQSTADPVQVGGQEKARSRGRHEIRDDVKVQPPLTRAHPEDNDFETVGSRLRKRRRIDPGNDESQSPPTSRSNRQKRSFTNLNADQSGVSTVDDFGDPNDSRNDPHISDSVQTSSKATNTELERPSIAGVALRGSQGASRAAEGLEGPGAENEPLLNGTGEDVGHSSNEPAAPDLSTVIESIIKHGETIDEHYAAKGLNEIGVVDTESFLPLGASAHLRIQSLPILDNLSVQILNVLAKSTYQEVVKITEDPESDAGQAYATLKSLFDHTKKVYSVHEPFLRPQELSMTDCAHVETIRKANLATFVSSVFGGQDVGFYHLNEYFLDTFVGEGGRLLKHQGQLFLDLKTQAFISARSYGQRPKEELLGDIFPTDMEERLLARKGSPSLGSKLLAPSETDFLQRARKRSQALMSDPSFQDVNALSKRYAWDDFLRDISNYISKNFESLLGQPMQKNGATGRPPNCSVPSRSQATPQAAQVDLEHQVIVGSANGDAFEDRVATASGNIFADAIQMPDAAVQGFGFHQAISLEGTDDTQSQPYSSTQDAQHVSLQQDEVQEDVNHGFPGPPPDTQYQYPPPPPHVFHNDGTFPMDPHPHPQLGTIAVNMNSQQQFYGDQPVNPHPTQSAPTQVLYERARQAATVKATPTTRRAGHPSQRRPWSHEEENALMAGLDRVKGPHWSQILAMFGSGGTINETLKDRNQVQLKDKARNLKLFFLKSGIEVPYYLQFVTGELKTRAPGQAAKNEAKERETDSEERAHVEGVFALAYGPDSVQDTESGPALDADRGASSHGPDYLHSRDRQFAIENVNAESVSRNDLSMPIANAAQSLSQAPQAPEANMMSFNQENPVTPNFQAMVDLAVAEAARVAVAD